MSISACADLRSSFRNAANCSGVVAAGTTACFSRKPWNFGSLKTFTNAALNFATSYAERKKISVVYADHD